MRNKNNQDHPVTISPYCLPDRYLITDDNMFNDSFMQRLQNHLQHGVRLIQFRSKSLGSDQYCDLAQQMLQCCKLYGARLLLNSEPNLAAMLGADGVHLTSSRLQQLSLRPLDNKFLVCASCHNEDELQHACHLKLDFAVLSPVAATRSHPQANPLGWNIFQTLVERVTLPVYALGGMQPADIPMALRCGGQGIAAIRGLWKIY